MNDLGAQIRHARTQIGVPWDETREHRIARGVRRTIRRQKMIGTATVAATLAVTVAVGLDMHRSPQLTSVAREPEPTSAIHLPDGSTVTLLDTHSQVIPEEVAETHIGVKLLGGRARFDVTRRPTRRFRVNAGSVIVEVLGTRFTVERESERERVGVSVHEGRVHITWAGGQRELGANEHDWFVDEGELAAPIPRPKAQKPRSVARDWKSLASQGSYARAWTQLQALAAPPDEPGWLLMAADVARNVGKPQAAVGYLKRIVAHHKEDPRAPLAAFTLGRVLLGDLQEPGQAAQAFANARAMAPEGSLAEHALAREVEAWHRAGDTTRASRLALEYVARFPGGRRLKSVSSYGGLP